MSGQNRHGAGLSDVVHSADEAPAEAVGGAFRRGLTEEQLPSGFGVL
jgi:hypothetical protein